MSSQPCGCDPNLEIPWVCEYHKRGAAYVVMADSIEQQNFIIKDSGKRQHFDSGMQRDVTTDKTDYSLIFDGPMLDRWAVHLTKGARKYDARNWMKANGQAELDRFKASAARHFIQWMRGDQDEDHASAVFFNINGYEYTKGKL
jgi:hypothetical protein